MRRLHIDCPSGIAGDMFLASLIDLGAPLDEVRRGLEKLGLTEPWSIRAERVRKQGISGLQLIVEVGGKVADVPGPSDPGPGGEHRHGHSRRHEQENGREHGRAPGPGRGHEHGDEHDCGHKHRHVHGHERDDRGHEHGHPHDPGHGRDHVHRPYRAIKELIARADLPDRVRSRALAVFERLARAEGAVHGIDPEDVHFHEVGSTDAIIDIVGASIALEWLDVGEITASPLNVGSGFVRSAHGPLPVPAPATLLLLQGLEAYQTGVTGELVTPTGAAIVAALAKSVGPMPVMRVERVGCGAGRMDLPIPNIVRSLLSPPLPAGAKAGAPGAAAGGAAEKASGSRANGDRPGGDLSPGEPVALDPVLAGRAVEDQVVELETNLDDLSPELLPVVIERLFQAGAKDVWLVPVTMKKGRPGWTLHALAAPGTEGRLAETIFRETTTLGIRLRPAGRWTLERDWVTVETAGGKVRVKAGRLGGAIVNLAPEFEDVYEAANASGLPLKVLMDLAREAARKELNKEQ